MNAACAEHGNNLSQWSVHSYQHAPRLTPSLCSGPLKRSLWLMPSPKWALISLARHKASLLPMIGQIGSPKHRDRQADRELETVLLLHTSGPQHCLKGTHKQYRQGAWQENILKKDRRGTIHERNKQRNKYGRKTREKCRCEARRKKGDGFCVHLSDGGGRRKGEIIKDGKGRKMGQQRERGRGEGEGWFNSLAHWKPVNQESISNLEICLGETGGGRNQRTARGERGGGRRGLQFVWCRAGEESRSNKRERRLHSHLLLQSWFTVSLEGQRSATSSSQWECYGNCWVHLVIGASTELILPILSKNSATASHWHATTMIDFNPLCLFFIYPLHSSVMNLYSEPTFPLISPPNWWCHCCHPSLSSHPASGSLMDAN